MKKTLIIYLLLLLSFSASAESGRIVVSHGPYLQAMGEREVTVVWTTSKDAVSWVEIAPDDGTEFHSTSRPRYYQVIFGRKNIGRVHAVKVDGLDPAKKYRYEISSREVVKASNKGFKYGTIVTETDGRVRLPLEFTTADTHKKELRFTMINDIHADSTRMGALLSEVGRLGTDFVVFNGDMVSSMKSEKQIFDGFMTTAVNRFASHIPFYYARGNHEARDVFASQYMTYFPTSTGKPYYTFNYGPAFFIVIDSGDSRMDDEKACRGLIDGERYRAEQGEWLKGVVAGDDFKNARYRIVIVHIPPVIRDCHSGINIEECFVPTLNKAGIDLLLCAHRHNYRYIPAGETSADFPILLNSNIKVVHTSIGEKGINLLLKDVKGNEFKNIDIPAR